MIARRPININPLSIRLPLPAWVSIAHRMSGLFVFLLIPFLLWVLDQSLSTESSYIALFEFVGQPWIKITLFVLLASLLFHLLAGIRHILMDMKIGESLKAGRMSAALVIVVAILSIAYAAYWLWG